ncbi:MAG: hypothetical protein R3D89_14135 [Sphingomonadaceae bacterium]
MDRFGNTGMADAIAGALDWWREAGVDCNFADDAQSWLAEEQEPQAEAAPPERKPAPKPATPAPEPEAPKLDKASIPNALPAFQDWWLAEPLLADGPPSRRVSPRGTAGAKLMVLVPEPEREDRETLLSGPQGKLLSAMLAAMGIAEDQAYLASALPRHTPGADWAAIHALGMADVIARHVALAAPERLMILGTNVLSLSGHEPPQGPAVLRIFNHEGGSVPLLAARGLPALLEQPRWRAAIWRSWLDW